MGQTGARRAGLREAVLLDVAGLYPDADCRRARRLEEVIAMLELAWERAMPRGSAAALRRYSKPPMRRS
jgi:hypothetical protein